MPFKPLLGALVERVPGARGAIVVDWEGEAVDQVGRMDEYDLKVIGAHQGVVLQIVRDVVGRSGDDQLEEIIITTEHAQILVLPVTQEYFLGVMLDRRTDILGKALLAARRCIQGLYHEIA